MFLALKQYNCDPGLCSAKKAIGKEMAVCPGRKLSYAKFVVIEILLQMLYSLNVSLDFSRNID